MRESSIQSVGSGALVFFLAYFLDHFLAHHLGFWRTLLLFILAQQGEVLAHTPRRSTGTPLLDKYI